MLTVTLTAVLRGSHDRLINADELDGCASGSGFVLSKSWKKGSARLIVIICTAFLLLNMECRVTFASPYVIRIHT